MGDSGGPKNEKVRRFEEAVHQLIDEGHSLFDYRGLLEAAAERAGVDLQEVHPTLH
jgi:hypothetical protein